MKLKYSKLCLALIAATATAHGADPLPTGTATSATKSVNQSYNKMLDFNNREDFELATKGFIATWPESEIKYKNGDSYDLHAYNFLENKPVADTANPSLWRQSQLTAKNGLFKVTDKIYQIRGFDISNMTLIEGKTGWIVIDPLISNEVAAAGLKLANDKLGNRPVKAVIFTHSHVDHFGGVLGIATQQDINSKKVQVIAPAGFAEEAISENLYAGNAMGRRAVFMYGRSLPNSATGNLGTGLGPATSSGTVSFAMPNKTVSKTGEKMTVDGVDIVFQMAPGTEAPSEMMFYFPQMKALCLSEDATSTMHNLYTLRGAKVRSPLVWSNALSETLALWGNQAEVSFASHHWPRWTNGKVKEHITKQRDMYKFINDQTLKLANQGYDGEEIAERLKLPDSLAKEFYNRGYYGSLNHNVKATYQLYLGFYNGNPATLHKLPRTESAKKYVTAMGGSDKVLKMGKEAFDKGDYRWTAEMVNHLVYAEPNNKQARDLQAAALEQMGYQSESGPWRDVYLSGAWELRGQKRFDSPPLVDPTTLPLAMILDYTGIRLNADKANNKTMTIGFKTTDTKENYTMVLNNSVIVSHKTIPGEKLDATYTMAASDLGNIIGGTKSFEDLQRDGKIKSTGKSGGLNDLVAMLDTFDPNFNLVTPVAPAEKHDDKMAQNQND